MNDGEVLCPISFSADFSVYNLFDGVKVQQGRMEYFSYVEENSREDGEMEEAKEQVKGNGAEGSIEASAVPKSLGLSANVFWGATAGRDDVPGGFLFPEKWLKIATLIWLTGIFAFLLHSAVSAYRLRKRLRSAVHGEANEIAP